MSDGDSSFLSRWSRRKAAVREGKPVPEEQVQEQVQPPAVLPSSTATSPDVAAAVPTPAASAVPMPTLADVAVLRPGDNIARFVAQGVDESVKRAALKTLFADPHFNVMDGLDTYIDDYSKPDPIPPEILRRLRQSETLGLFDPVEEAEDVAEVEEAGKAGKAVDDAAASQAPQPGQGLQAAMVEEPTASSEPDEDPAADKHA
ncbi:DUF3306 domain-containing protein [Cupriavidus metallidurans]|jgi:hypothetical protein|uniref:DUF3306 domain-containing protein n=1 Tax=Cupriavidus metallidurans TaxID=119219 RepID=UPI000CE05E4F|nr:DUF3306 domain-containing protein [Cupriavidus metallidurans]AVA36802.1 DUF3306 domain-containing protein [Cupriavidus metallidurans]